MPKKTKKEKLLARQRRSLAPPMVAHERIENKVPESANPNLFSFSLDSASTPAPSRKQYADIDYGYMKRDLIKTLLITVAILASEVMLTKWLPQ